MAASSKPAWSTIVTDRAGEVVCSKEKKIMMVAVAGSWSCGGLKGRGQRLRPEEAAVATGAHGRLGVGAPRTRPLRPAGPAHCRSGLRAERADHRERAAWGSRGGRARAAPSFPLPSALGPRGPRRSEKMALHFQVSVPGCGPGAPAVAGGGRGPRPRPRASTAPCPGTASRRRAALAHPSPPSSAWAAATSGQVGAGAEGPPGSPHAQPAVGALLGSLDSEAGAAGARERG